MTESLTMFHALSLGEATEGLRSPSESGTPSTSSLRAAIVTRSMVHLHAALEVVDAPGGETSMLDERARRRERLLHQLALERQRQRRRRSA